MLYRQVGIAAMTYILPDEILTSEDLENRLSPVYERLSLPAGRLEMMTGIRARRIWPSGTAPSTVSAQAGRRALEQAALAPAEVDCLLHCSVCRDFLEPATSTVVHHLLGLPAQTLNFDISNACLGLLSGIQTAAAMIEAGAIRNALLVSGENSRPLIESTLAFLLNTPNLTRKDTKEAFASLTIGSAAAAVVLRRLQPDEAGHRLLGGVSRSNTDGHHLCRGTADVGMTGASMPLMRTDAEGLLVQGVEVARQTWDQLKLEFAWTERTPELVCTHQVGRIHREKLYQALGLDLAKDFATVETLGNCGSASLPVTTALAAEAGRLKAGTTLALLGIGSGINCTMMGVTW